MLNFWPMVLLRNRSNCIVRQSAGVHPASDLSGAARSAPLLGCSSWLGRWARIASDSLIQLSFFSKAVTF